MHDAFGTDALLREFMEEAEEHFDVLDTGLLALESAVRDGTGVDERLVNELFRSVHTVKGLSAMFELVDVKDLAHSVEGVFDRMRRGGMLPDEACLEQLFHAADVLRRAVAEAADPARDARETTAAAHDLDALVAGDGAETAQAAAETGELSEYASRRLEEAPGQGLRAIRITLRWGIELRLGTLRRRHVERSLGTGGELLEVRPLLAGLPQLDEFDPVDGDVAVVAVAVTDRTDQDVADDIGIGVSAIAALEGHATRPADTAASTGDAQRGAVGGALGASATDIVRVDIRRLDGLVDLTGELVTGRTRLAELSSEIARRMGKDDAAMALSSAVKEVGLLVDQLQEHVMSLRMVPLGHLFSKFPRAIRDLAKMSGKEISLLTEGADTEIDKRVIERVEDPLLHIVRNACDHGIEGPEDRVAAGKPACASLTLAASQVGNHILIEVRDDGRGLDVERISRRAAELGLVAPGELLDHSRLIDTITAPGFSTASAVTDVSGRGVGLDVVKRKLAELGGTLEVDTVPGEGSTFRLRIPLTLAIIPALLVRCGGSRFAVPLAAVGGVLRIRARDVRTVQGVEVLDLRGETLPLAWLTDVLRLRKERELPDKRFVVETQAGGERFGLVVDGMAGQQEIVVKDLGNAVGDTPGISGATILGDGSVVPIVDIDRFVGLFAASRAAMAAAEVSVDA
jgi:two-component system, chemotaxis family, sensor kinase CheA